LFFVSAISPVDESACAAVSGSDGAHREDIPLIASKLLGDLAGRRHRLAGSTHGALPQPHFYRAMQQDLPLFSQDAMCE
jgi:hypothetical protein